MQAWLIQLTRATDALLGRLAVIYFKGGNPRQPWPAAPQQVAVIKLWAIGEAVLTLPALHALIARYPQAQLTVITTAYVAPVYRGQPGVHRVQILPRKPWSLVWYIWTQRKKFKMAIDFEPYLYVSALLARFISKYSVGFSTRRRAGIYSRAVHYNDQQHVTRTYRDLVADRGVITNLMPLHYELADIAAVKHFFGFRGIALDQLVVIAPSVGGSAKSRQWPAKLFAQVADALGQQGAHIALVGSHRDGQLLSIIQDNMHQPSTAITHFSLAQVAALLAQCRLLIANDSGLMHVGACMGTPTLGLFGPNLPLRFRPLNRLSRYLYDPCAKSPHINVHRGQISNQACTCLQRLSVAQVLREAAVLIDAYA